MRRAFLIIGIIVIVVISVDSIRRYSNAHAHRLKERQKEDQVRRTLSASANTTRESILNSFDLTSLQIDKNLIFHGGPPIDGIPSMTNPTRVQIDKADSEIFTDDARVAQVVLGGEAVAYPLAILNSHEIANDIVGGIPIAVTYCPLCDSVLVFNRRIQTDDGAFKTLEFGVSGLLMNSNVLMYDRTDFALWSQGMMQAISGPHSGMMLQTYPVQVTTMKAYRSRHPNGETLALAQPNLARKYLRNIYQDRGYFESDRLWFPVRGAGDAFPAKTLGLGIKAGTRILFVPIEEIPKHTDITIESKLGPIVVTSNEAGVFVNSAPDGVKTMQVFYFAWSAFHPQTEVFSNAEQPTLPQPHSAE